MAKRPEPVATQHLLSAGLPAKSNVFPFTGCCLGGARGGGGGLPFTPLSMCLFPLTVFNSPVEVSRLPRVEGLKRGAETHKDNVAPPTPRRRSGRGARNVFVAAILWPVIVFRVCKIGQWSKGLRCNGGS